MYGDKQAQPNPAHFLTNLQEVIFGNGRFGRQGRNRSGASQAIAPRIAGNGPGRPAGCRQVSFVGRL